MPPAVLCLIKVVWPWGARYMPSGPLLVGNGVMSECSEWSPNSMFLASLVVSEETVGVGDSEGVLVVGAHAARDVSPRESYVIVPVMRRRWLECWLREQRLLSVTLISLWPP